MPPKKIPRLVIAAALVVALGSFAPLLFSNSSANSSIKDVAIDNGPSPFAVLVKMFVGIGVTAALCVGFTRWLSPRKPATPNSSLELLASLPLDARMSVHLVRIGERKLLVGTDPSGVKAVTELPVAHANVLGPIRISAAELTQELVARR